MTAAAAMLVVVGIGGLVLTTSTTDEEPASTSPLKSEQSTPVAADPTNLATVTQIAMDEWLIPSNPPADTGFLFADLAQPAGSRTVRYGYEDGTTTLTITIDTQLLDEVTGTTLNVDGVDWNLTKQPESWDATRRVGDSVVRVSSSSLDSAEREGVLADLHLVETADLPLEPLDLDMVQNDGRDVASFTISNETLTMRVTSQNNHYCVQRYIGAAAAGGCGDRLDPATDLASGLQQGSATSDDAQALILEAAGIVAPDVTRIEVDFINGETVTTTPTDHSGTFAARFWIAGARMELDGNQNLSVPYAISEVRGFDSDGNLLYTQDSGSEGVRR